MKTSKILLILLAGIMVGIFFNKKNAVMHSQKLKNFIEKAIIQQTNDKKETSEVLYKFAELFIRCIDKNKKAEQCLLNAYDNLNDVEKLIYAKKIFSPIIFIESFSFLNSDDAKNVIQLSKINKPDKNIIERLFDNKTNPEDHYIIRNYMINLFKNIGDSESEEWRNYFMQRIDNHLNLSKLSCHIDAKILRKINIGRSANAISVTDITPEDILIYTTTTYNNLNKPDEISANLWVAKN
jgi:hypothetical protein